MFVASTTEVEVIVGAGQEADPPVSCVVDNDGVLSYVLLLLVFELCEKIYPQHDSRAVPETLLRFCVAYAC